MAIDVLDKNLIIKEPKEVLNDKKKEKRKQHLDILKIIACFLVIVNHTDNRIFFTFGLSKESFLSVIYLFLCKVAVPIFIMVSGAVLLGKEEGYKTVYKKRILKTFFVIMLFSILYYINNLILHSETFSITGFIGVIWNRPITNAYWYLYMYIGLLIMLPITRKMVKNMNTKDYIYSFIIWAIVVGTLPIIIHYFKLENISEYFSIPIFSGYIVYFIIGYFIENKLEIKYFNQKILILLLFLSILCIGISVGLTYYEYVNQGNIWFMDNINFITIAIPSITMFYGCKYFSLRGKNLKNNKITTKIATCTFGIYLISDILIQKLEFVYDYMIIHIHKLLAVLILEIMVFLIGLIFIFVLRKIPIVKKLI